MNWLKNNLIILALGVVFAVLLGVIGWHIHKSYGELRTIEADLQAKQDRIQQLKAAPIPPSKDTIAALRRDRRQLLRHYNDIQQKVSGATITPSPVTRDPAFNLFLVETLTGLRKAAGNSNTNLESFAFGFGHYREAYPCRLAKVRGEDCERLLGVLAKQIMIVDKITRLLFDSGTHAILEIKREQVPPEPLGTDTIPWDGTTKTNALYTILPFQFKFACNQTQVLQTFLNKLAGANLFYKVKDLTIETEKEVEAAVSPARSTVSPVESPAKTEARYRLIVTARIDWVEFAAATNATAATGPLPTR
jgi:hypothetical protein